MACKPSGCLPEILIASHLGLLRITLNSLPLALCKRSPRSTLLQDKILFCTLVLVGYYKYYSRIHDCMLKAKLATQGAWQNL